MQPCSFQNRCGSEQAWRFACSGAQPCFKSPRGCSCQAGSGACHFTDTKGAEKWHGHICSVLPLVFTGSSDGENVRKVTTESKLLTDLYGTDTRELSAFRGWCYSKARSWDLLAKGWLAPSRSCQMQREANPSSDLWLRWVLGTGCSSSSHCCATCRTATLCWVPTPPWISQQLYRAALVRNSRLLPQEI